MICIKNRCILIQIRLSDNIPIIFRFLRYDANLIPSKEWILIFVRSCFALATAGVFDMCLFLYVICTLCGPCCTGVYLYSRNWGFLSSNVTGTWRWSGSSEQRTKRNKKTIPDARKVFKRSQCRWKNKTQSACTNLSQTSVGRQTGSSVRTERRFHFPRQPEVH